MASEGKEGSVGHQEKLTDKNNYEGKFNTLRIISLQAINEFETLQKKCEENYAKYLEERENYMRTKKELDVLKEVSGEALGEYENLHRKFTIEQGCRDKAEEFAKQAVNENKQLKRQSAMIINTLTTKMVDIDLGELANAAENVGMDSIEDHGLCNKQIEGLKEQVESLKIKIDELSEKLSDAEEKLQTEQEDHKKTKEDLLNNNANFKQLNRVSLLAIDDYAYLQQKYEMEVQNRVQAEQLADEEELHQPVETNTDEEELHQPVETNTDEEELHQPVETNTDEMSREHEALVKQSEFVPKEVSKDEVLQKALNEISTLTKQLHDQKVDFDGKVKELENELASSNDVQKLQNLEKKILTFSQGMETLESRLEQAQSRANEAEVKAKQLEEKLRTKEASDVVPAPPPLPPPPPPPPAPTQLLRKFVGIMGGGKRTKSKKTAEKEDPRIKAMSEMMDRIKTGRVELKKVECNKSKDEKEGEAMQNLKHVLKSIKRSQSKESLTRKPSDSEDGEKTKTFGVHLRKPGTRKPRSVSNVDDENTILKTVTLRKPRSRSTGDILDNDDDEVIKTQMDKDLLKLLKKRKASSDRDVKPPVPLPDRKSAQGIDEEKEINGKEHVVKETNGTEQIRGTGEINGTDEPEQINETGEAEEPQEKQVKKTDEVKEQVEEINEQKDEQEDEQKNEQKDEPKDEEKDEEKDEQNDEPKDEQKDEQREKEENTEQ